MRICIVGNEAIPHREYWLWLSHHDCYVDYLDKLPIQPYDLVILAGYPEIVKIDDITRHKNIINVHTSLLPKYRGRHPINWALVNGEREIGITIHYVDAGIDTGDIILQDSVVVLSDDTYDSILARLVDKGKRMLMVAVKQVEQDCVYRRVQHEELSTYWRKRTPKDSEIDWDKSPTEIINMVRGMSGEGMPKAYTTIKGEKVCLQISKNT